MCRSSQNFLTNKKYCSVNFTAYRILKLISYSYCDSDCWVKISLFGNTIFWVFDLPSSRCTKPLTYFQLHWLFGNWRRYFLGNVSVLTSSTVPKAHTFPSNYPSIPRRSWPWYCGYSINIAEKWKQKMFQSKISPTVNWVLYFVVQFWIPQCYVN